MVKKEKLGVRSSIWYFCVVIMLFIFSILSSGCGSKFDTLPESEVDLEMKADAERIGTTLLTAIGRDVLSL